MMNVNTWSDFLPVDMPATSAWGSKRSKYYGGDVSDDDLGIIY